MFEKSASRPGVSYNWRDEFLNQRAMTGTRNPTFVNAFEEIDLNLSYDINDALAVSFEAINLTGEDYAYPAANGAWSTGWTRNSTPRYLLGVRYSSTEIEERCGTKSIWKGAAVLSAALSSCRRWESCFRCAMAEMYVKPRSSPASRRIAFRRSSCSRQDSLRSSRASRATGRWCAAASSRPQSAIAYCERFGNPNPSPFLSGTPKSPGDFSTTTISRLQLQGAESAARPTRSTASRHNSATAGRLDLVGSTDIDLYLPELRKENDLLLNGPAFEFHRPIVSIWLGNRTVASAHYDSTHNLACCAVGRRRFTLFPPEQVHNLYPGPLEPTPGGQVISMVDFEAAGFRALPAFPRGARGRAGGGTRAGRCSFLSGHVVASRPGLESFNALVNYWWTTSPRYIDSPQVTMMHALLSLRDRPAREKAAWRAMFSITTCSARRGARPNISRSTPAAILSADGQMKARRLRRVPDEPAESLKTIDQCWFECNRQSSRR